ncbi:MAG: IS200/IS605 family transposase [Bacteroidia bacterium]
MANTYTQIHIHAVFAVQNRLAVIHKEWKDELYKYISGIIKNNNHKPLCINGMPDHIHILFGMRPSQSLSELMQDIKADSCKWINDRNFVREKFAWQKGYGAFTYGKSQLSHIIGYIEKQEEHHKKKTFTDEYRDILNKFEVEYDERFLFKPIQYT